jgi:hypothetical protein
MCPLLLGAGEMNTYNISAGKPRGKRSFAIKDVRTIILKWILI